MERLTARDEQGFAHYPYCFEKCDGDITDEKCAKCNFEEKICNKLADYEDLEEQGLQLRLFYPLETDEVFLADEDSKEVYILDAREFSPFKMDSKSEIIYRIDCHDFVASDFGKILFLTEQEAQSALEKMKGE